MANKSLCLSYRSWSEYQWPTTLDAIYTDGGRVNLQYYNVRDPYYCYSYSSTWSSKSWNVGATGTPATSIRNSGKDVGIFYRSGVKGEAISCISWDSGSTKYEAGWSEKPEIIVSRDVAFDPGAVGRDSTHIELVWTSSAGALKRRGWDYGEGGWMPIGEIMHADIVSTPSIVSRNPTSMDGVAIKNNGDLVHFWWDVKYSQNSGWQWETWGVNATGNPAIINPDNDSYCCLCRNGQGQLVVHNWSSISGHSQKVIPAKMNSDPAALSLRGAIYVVYVETNGDLVILRTDTEQKQVLFKGNALASTPRISIAEHSQFHTFTYIMPEIVFWDKNSKLRRINVNPQMAVITSETLPSV
ncbi:MAG: hypothetical protein PVI21_03260 [Candidatus Woesebacteria bacterium]|jgi:hypothetical protein